MRQCSKKDEKLFAICCLEDCSKLHTSNACPRNSFLRFVRSFVAGSCRVCRFKFHETVWCLLPMGVLRFVPLVEVCLVCIGFFGQYDSRYNYIFGIIVVFDHHKLFEVRVSPVSNICLNSYFIPSWDSAAFRWIWPLITDQVFDAEAKLTSFI